MLSKRPTSPLASPVALDDKEIPFLFYGGGEPLTLDAFTGSWTDIAAAVAAFGASSQAVSDRVFPERGASTSEAKALCRTCLVRDDCLRYALDEHIKNGIWGGRSERERRKVRATEGQAA